MSFCYTADNGKPSELYSQLKDLYGEEKAYSIYMNTRTNDFMKWLGSNWISISKEMLSIAPETIDYYKLLSNNNNIIDKLDSNYEPKIFNIDGEYYFMNNKNQLQSIVNKRDKDITKDNQIKVLKHLLNKLNLNPIISSKGNLIDYSTMSINPNKFTYNTSFKDLLPILLKDKINLIKYPKTYLNESNLNDNVKKIHYLQNQIELKLDTFKSIIEDTLNKVSAILSISPITLNTKIKDIVDKLDVDTNESIRLNYPSEVSDIVKRNVEHIKNKSNEVLFDNSITNQVNVYTKRPEKNHTYKYNNDLSNPIDMSVSSLKDLIGDPNYTFDVELVTEKFILNWNDGNIYNTYFSNDDKAFQLLKQAIALNDINVLIEQRPELDNNFEVFDMFDKITGIRTKWAWTAELGTENHEMIQAFLKEEENLTDYDNDIIKKYTLELDKKLLGNGDTLFNDESIIDISNITDNNIVMNMLDNITNNINTNTINTNIEKIGTTNTINKLKSIKNILNLVRVDYDKEGNKKNAAIINNTIIHINSFLIPLEKEHSVDIARKKIIEDTLKFKEDIKNRGGYIETELVVHNNSAIINREVKSIAGSIDIIAIFEDGVEIYDIKTMNDYLSNNKDMYKELEKGKSSIDEEFSRYSGYKPNKQGQHSLQVLAYIRMFEKMTGIKVKGAGIMQLTIETLEIDRINNTATPVIIDKNNAKYKSQYQYGKPIAENRLNNNPIVINLQALNDYGKNALFVNSIFGEISEEMFKSQPSMYNKEETIDDIIDKSGLTLLVEDIKISLERQLDRLKQINNETKLQQLIREKEQELKDNPNNTELIKEIKEYKEDLENKDTKELKARIKRLQGELNDYEGFAQVSLYIDTSYEEFYGNPKSNIFGYKRQFELIRDSFYNRTKKAKQVSEDLDRIRLNLHTYTLLDKIDSFIKTDSKLANKVIGTDVYDKLQKTLSAKTEILNNYNSLMIDVMTELMLPYISQSANTQAVKIKEVWDNQYKEDISVLNQVLDNMIKSGKTDIETRPIREKIIKKEQENQRWLDNYNDRFYLDKASIKQSLTQLSQDIGNFERYFVSASSTSDTTLAIFMTMLRWKLDDSDRRLKDIELDISRALTDFQNYDKSTLLHSGDSTSYYDFMLEEVEDWVSSDEITTDNEVIKKKEMKKSYTFINPFGKKPFTLILDGKEHKGEYTHDVIIKNYKYRLRELSDKGLSKEYRKLLNEYNNWFENNMEKEYTPDYYLMNQYLKDDTKKLLEDIREQINEIKDIAKADKRNDFFLNDDELKAIKKLRHKERQLASIYNEDNSKKADRAYDMAIELQEYKKLYNERHIFEQSEAKFEAARKQAKELYKNNELSYKKWLEDNKDYQITDTFYNRLNRLRLEKKVFEFSNIEKKPELLNYINTQAVQGLNDYDFIETVNKYVDDNGYRDLMNSSKLNTDEIDKEIYDLTRPYKNGNTYDYMNIPLSTYQRLQELEQKKQDVFESMQKWQPNELLSIFGDEDSISNFFNILDEYKSRIDDFANFVLRLQYQEIFERKKYDFNEMDIKPTFEEFYEMNHISVSKKDEDGEVYYEKKPLTIWTQVLPVNRTYNTSIQYDIDKKAILDKIKEDEPGRDDKYYQVQLEKTQWYKDSHYTSGDIKEQYRTILQPDDLYIKEVYTDKFSTPIVKDEYKRNDIDIYDNRGYLLPLKDKWINPKYVALQKDSTKFKFYTTLLNQYLEAQKNHPITNRLGYKIPYATKAAKERLADTEFKQMFKDVVKRGIGSFVVEDRLHGDTAKQRLGLDDMSLPIQYTSYIPIEDTSKDVLSSVVSYIKHANKYGALDDMLATVRNLHSVIRTRDREGTIKRTTEGNKQLDSVAARLGIDRYLIDSEGGSIAGAMFTKTVMMQLFNEMNTPYESIVPGINSKIRWDKFGDNIMMLTAMTQLGGLPWQMATLAKGLANSLQANMQLFLESWSNQYYTTSSWWKARQRTTTKGHKDIITDFGKLTRESLTGLLVDAYDPMQGEYFDKAGNELNKSQFYKIINTDTVMFNQYAGELDAAITSMFTMLDSHKIVNKEVYTLQEYIDMRAKQDNKEVTTSYRNQLVSDFNAIELSLLDVYQKDEKTGKLSVDTSKVNWKIGGKKDKQIKDRLHSINKQLNGAYSSIDKTAVETNVFGRFLMMYKKYIIPSARKRFGKLQRDEELGDFREGYLRVFLYNAMTDMKSIAGVLLGRHEWVKTKDGKPTTSGNIKWIQGIFNKSYRDKINPDEEIKLRKAFHELGIIVSLTILLSMIAPDDDDDKSQITGVQWFMLYELERLRKEMNGLILFTPGSWEDNWKQVKSPSAAVGGLQRVVAFTMQTWSDFVNLISGQPFDVYETTSGLNEKGDSKFWAKFFKMFGNYNTSAAYNFGSDYQTKEMKIMYENLNKSGQ